MVERTTGISSELASGAALLAELVNHFKLNRRGTIRDQVEQSGATPKRRAA